MRSIKRIVCVAGTGEPFLAQEAQTWGSWWDAEVKFLESLDEGRDPNPDLIVLRGFRAGSGIQPALTFDLTSSVECRYNVLLAQPGPASGPVLVATTLSDSESPVVAAGAEIARRFQTALTVIHVLEPTSTPVEGPSAGASLTTGSFTADAIRLRTDGHDRVSAAMAQAGAAGLAVVEEGTPASTILRESRRLGARLLVMGTDASTPARLPRTVERAAREASGSLLVVAAAKIGSTTT